MVAAFGDAEEGRVRVRESLGWRDVFLENPTVRGRAWYKLLDAPVLTLDMTV